MPGKKVGAKENRLTKHRDAVRDEIVSSLLEITTHMVDMTFGLINKHSGNGQLAVTLPNKLEARAVLRGLLSKCNIKNVFPVGSIVVLGVRDFDTKTYDVMATLTRKDAKQLVKQDKMPAWMLSSADGAKEGSDEGFVFEEEEVEVEKEETKEEDKARRESKRNLKRPDAEEDDVDIEAI